MPALTGVNSVLKYIFLERNCRLLPSPERIFLNFLYRILNTRNCPIVDINSKDEHSL